MTDILSRGPLVSILQMSEASPLLAIVVDVVDGGVEVVPESPGPRAARFDVD